MAIPASGGIQNCSPAIQEQVLHLSTQILTQSWSGGSRVPCAVKQLLSSIKGADYHDYKDRVLLTAVLDDLRSIQDENSPIFLDPEAFYNVLSVTKSVVASQPQNLIRFTARAEGQPDFLTELLTVGRRLHQERARNPLLSPVGQLGMAQVDFAVQSIVDILFSFALTEPTVWMTPVMNHYLGLLLCDDASVSHASKTALQRAMKAGSNKSAVPPSSAAKPEAAKLASDEDDIMRLAIAMSLDQSEAQSSGASDVTSEDSTSSQNFKQLRLALLQRITEDLPELKKKGGVKSIHFLQVNIMKFGFLFLFVILMFCFN